MDLIRINNYFFEPSSYSITPHIIGETRRTSFGGKLHTDYTNEYHTFELTFEDLSKEQLEIFQYLKSLAFPPTGIAQDLLFVDDVGNEYTVTIPVDGFDFDREEGDIESYTVELTFEEVIED